MSNKIHIRVNPSEGHILGAAAHIYAAFIVCGAVNAASEDSLVTKAVEIAIRMAQQLDERVHCDDEIS